MAYRYEKDGTLVIDGWENGIANSPHEGISDVRNVDITSVPGEASVTFKTTLSTSQAAITNNVFTANSSTDTITYTGPAIVNNTAITVANSGGALPGGLTANKAFYVVNATATTFQLSVDGGGASCAAGASILDITNNGSGTNTFSTINIGKVKNIVTQNYRDKTGNATGVLYYANDANGRCWYYSGQTQWVYMNNLSGENVAGVNDTGNGLVAWKNTLFDMASQNVVVILTNVISTGVVQTLAYQTTHANWNLSWMSISTESSGYSPTISHLALAGQDDIVYFCNANFVASIAQKAGQVFDPTNAATYTQNPEALTLPTFEIAQCLAELGVNLLIGGQFNKVYPWDRTSTNFSYPIWIAEDNIVKMVTVNTTTYIFAGQRGRIYLTNGTQANDWKKLPDHLSGTVAPYYTWGGVASSRNQIYFGVSATDNAGNAINNYGGLWAIDLSIPSATVLQATRQAVRLLNQMSYGTYAGQVSAICAIPSNSTGNGHGLISGWTSDGTTANGGIDVGSSNPYSGGQSYVDSDLIPIGTAIVPVTSSQVEFKLTVPLVSGESITLQYRQKFSDNYTTIFTYSTAGDFSANSSLNFEKSQWIQYRAVLTSTNTNPSYVRLKQIRINP